VKWFTGAKGPGHEDRWTLWGLVYPMESAETVDAVARAEEAAIREAVQDGDGPIEEPGEFPTLNGIP